MQLQLCMQHSSLSKCFEVFAGIDTFLSELCRCDSKGNHSCCWSRHLLSGSSAIAAEGNDKDISSHVVHSFNAVPCLWLTSCVLFCSLLASRNMLLSLQRYVNATSIAVLQIHKIFSPAFHGSLPAFAACLPHCIATVCTNFFGGHRKKLMKKRCHA